MSHSSLQSAYTFSALLRDNKQAAKFYDSCTSTQKRAILSQLHDIPDVESMKAFVEHLPSATL